MKRNLKADLIIMRYYNNEYNIVVLHNLLLDVFKTYKKAVTYLANVSEKVRGEMKTFSFDFSIAELITDFDNYINEVGTTENKQKDIDLYIASKHYDISDNVDSVSEIKNVEREMNYYLEMYRGD